jgi:RNA polymerase sigma-70 factor (ECF subfamily)
MDHNKEGLMIRIEALLEDPNGNRITELGQLQETELNEFYSCLFMLAKIIADNRTASFGRDYARRNAEDIAANAVMQVHRKFSQFNGESKFTTWFHTIVHNLVSEHQRKDNRSNRATSEVDNGPTDDTFDFDTFVLDKIVSCESSPDERLLKKENAVAVRTALAQLSHDHQNILRLYMERSHDLSLDQMAVELNIPPGTFRSRFSRALPALGRELQKQYPDQFDTDDSPIISLIPIKERNRMIDEFIRKDPGCLEKSNIPPAHRKAAEGVIIKGESPNVVAKNLSINEGRLNQYLADTRTAVMGRSPGIFKETASKLSR